MPAPQVPIPLDTEFGFVAGTLDIVICPSYKTQNVSYIKIYSPSANVVTLDVNKGTPLTAYSFTLSAGDVLVDTNGYILQTGDKLTLTTTSNCVVFIKGLETPASL